MFIFELVPLIHGAEDDLPCPYCSKPSSCHFLQLLNTIFAMVWFGLLFLLFKAIPNSISINNGKPQNDAEKGRGLTTFELYQDYFAIGV